MNSVAKEFCGYQRSVHKGSVDTSSFLTGSVRTRSGILQMEALIACLVLVVAMSFASNLVFRINLIWADVQQHQFALSELSNQLDELTRLPKAEVEKRIETLQPSELCKKTLSEPEISGTLQEDELGTRIDLQVNWKRKHAGNPVELSGWLSSLRIGDATNSKSEDLE